MSMTTLIGRAVALSRRGRLVLGAGTRGRGQQKHHRRHAEQQHRAPPEVRRATAPPTTGPITAPPMKHANQMPMAALRCRASRNMVLISDSVDGAMVAPAMPEGAAGDDQHRRRVEYAATIEAMPKPAAPIISSSPRPMRSPSVPMVIMKPDSMKLYTSMIQSCCVLLA